jgi:hypothetical protein
MTAREAAHRLWPDHVALDPKDDPARKGPSPGQVMDKLLQEARMARQVNTKRNQLQ